MQQIDNINTKEIMKQIKAEVKRRKQHLPGGKVVIQSYYKPSKTRIIIKRLIDKLYHNNLIRFVYNKLSKISFIDNILNKLAKFVSR